MGDETPAKAERLVAGSTSFQIADRSGASSAGLRDTTFHSYLSATMGSTRIARREGG